MVNANERLNVNINNINEDDFQQLEHRRNENIVEMPAKCDKDEKTCVCDAMYANMGAIYRNMYGCTYCGWCNVILRLFIANVNNYEMFS